MRVYTISLEVQEYDADGKRYGATETLFMQTTEARVMPLELSLLIDRVEREEKREAAALALAPRAD